MDDSNRVVIAGAGPVGLMAALALAREGIPVVVCESSPQPMEDLRASTFHPPTLDLLDVFGLTGRMLADGLIARTWQFRDRQTGPVAIFDLELLRNDTNHPYRLQCEQFKLVRFILDDLAAYDHAEVRFSHTAAAVQQDADRVTLVARTPEGAVPVTGRYLIGADGSGSAVRGALEIGFGGFTYEELFLTVSTPYEFADCIPELSYINYITAPDEWLVLLRVKDFWRVVFPTDLDIPREQALSPDHVQERLRSVAGRAEPYEVSHATLYRIHQRVADRYRAGRVFLAGDAAHVNNPLGGMGLNGGLQDALNLAGKLAEVWRGADERLLDRYQRQRKPIAEEYVKEATMRNQTIMRERDPKVRQATLDELRATAADPERAYQYVLRSSMISAVRRSNAIA